MPFYFCFSLGGHLDFIDFLQKRFYNINYRFENDFEGLFVSVTVVGAMDIAKTVGVCIIMRMALIVFARNFYLLSEQNGEVC